MNIRSSNMERSLEELLARRDELRGRIKAIHRDLARGIGQDYEEQAIKLENLEVLQEIARVAEKELHEVEVTLADLQKSTGS
ncbi:MAG: hypothetical protein ACO3KY_00900 [Lysobacterales bacterium]